MADIIGIKLSSGEEVIGAFNEKSVPNEKLVLDKPVALVHVRTDRGVKATFMPVVHAAADLQTLEFNYHTLAILPYTVSSDVEKAYRENTSPLDLSAVKL